MKQKLLHYWLGMNAAAFDAACKAAGAYISLAVASAAGSRVGLEVPPLDLKQLAAVFLLTFLYGLLAWIQAHPVEDLIPSGIQPDSGQTPAFPPNAVPSRALTGTATAPAQLSGSAPASVPQSSIVNPKIS